MNIKKEKKTYTIEFLKEAENYEINLKSKNACLPADYWRSPSSSNLLGNSGLCESDSKMHVKRIFNKTEENTEKIEETSKIKAIEPIKEKSLEIEMPSTAKFNLNWLYLVWLAGNLYYVCKK